MNVSFRQLRIFAEVARTSSMSRAAEALHLTPPAVSMQIRELEEQVGLILLDRHGRSLSLSTAGEYFLVHARRMLAQLNEAEKAMARLRKLELGTLSIGIVSTAEYFVPALLGKFHQDHPGIEVRLRVLPNREQLVAAMEAGEIDLSIMGRPPKDIATRAEAFAAHPLVFVCHPAHPLGEMRHPPVQALAPHAFIAREHGSGTRAAMDGFLERYRVTPQITMEMPSNETIKQAVMAGMGIAFLSLHTLGLELRNQLLRIVPVEDTPVMRMWNIVHVQSRLLSPAAEAFRYFVLENGEQHLRAHDEGLLALLDASRNLRPG